MLIIAIGSTLLYVNNEKVSSKESISAQFYAKGIQDLFLEGYVLDHVPETLPQYFRILLSDGEVTEHIAGLIRIEESDEQHSLTAQYAPKSKKTDHRTPSKKKTPVEVETPFQDTLLDTYASLEQDSLGADEELKRKEEMRKKLVDQEQNAFEEEKLEKKRKEKEKEMEEIRRREAEEARKKEEERKRKEEEDRKREVEKRRMKDKEDRRKRLEQKRIREEEKRRMEEMRGTGDHTQEGKSSGEDEKQNTGKKNDDAADGHKPKELEADDKATQNAKEDGTERKGADSEEEPQHLNSQPDAPEADTEERKPIEGSTEKEDGDDRHSQNEQNSSDPNDSEKAIKSAETSDRNDDDTISSQNQTDEASPNDSHPPSTKSELDVRKKGESEKDEGEDNETERDRHAPKETVEEDDEGEKSESKKSGRHEDNEEQEHPQKDGQTDSEVSTEGEKEKESEEEEERRKAEERRMEEEAQKEKEEQMQREAARVRDEEQAALNRLNESVLKACFPFSERQPTFRTPQQLSSRKANSSLFRVKLLTQQSEQTAKKPSECPDCVIFDSFGVTVRSSESLFGFEERTYNWGTASQRLASPHLLTPLSPSKSSKQNSVPISDVIPSFPTSYTVSLPTHRRSHSRIRHIPSFSETPPNKQDMLFLHSLEQCSFICDFSPHADEASIADRNLKTNYLRDLLQFIADTSYSFPETTWVPVLKMVSINLFRSLPIPEFPPPIYGDTDRDFLFLDPSWEHLQYVYDLLYRFINSPNVVPKTATPYFPSTFLISLMDLFDSPDPREREALKTIIHRFYARYLTRRNIIRSTMGSHFQRLAFHHIQFNGTQDLLDLLVSIVHGFTVPLKEEHVQFFRTCVLPLNTVEQIDSFIAPLSHCLCVYLQKDPALIKTVVSFLIRVWPLSNPHKQVLMVTVLEEIIEAVPTIRLTPFAAPLFQLLASCITSTNCLVVDRALSLLSNDTILGLISSTRQLSFPILYASLSKNTNKHWDGNIMSLSFSALSVLVQIDQRLAAKCQSYERKKNEKLAEIRAARDYHWQMVEQLAQLNSPASPPPPDNPFSPGCILSHKSRPTCSFSNLNLPTLKSKHHRVSPQSSGSESPVSPLAETKIPQISQSACFTNPSTSPRPEVNSTAASKAKRPDHSPLVRCPS
ncbi:putative Serine/threonine protein phosphatase 2A 57 kDa regulatory subunit B' kappa [Blattamonas nauphoetae]|uniref:Serine/threonine protein phosphatase 2A 57 kDa regulatory subunit B' kappa n=1 Tax=Blattamonas nauphoetae TaxID=2049346 RepID=A0ABQ9XGM3_9EUKA|nr:putative Serine/threonine protein phosphatase 2A 57 kDa regulatory subunit B' kappa [Blattamonas nauphoetae]